ncbi:hypothetical protein PRUB_a3681 [Pseudoalteromonas rubra]|uniref:Uncharacterized protein n=1 Tax=Pseudoalteromonas rubra TaxID=43658 RepID=A0A8T0C7Y0_9GAMM|nr:hypothetical protein PRUB_a3681 [Pseudoalteromonas rubra]
MSGQYVTDGDIGMSECTGFADSILYHDDYTKLLLSKW